MWNKKTGHAGLQIIDGWKNFWGRAIPQIPGDRFPNSAYKPEAKPGSKSEPSGCSAPAVLVASANHPSPQDSKQGRGRFVNFLPRADLLHRMSREPRLKLQLPVRVFGMSKAGRPFVANATTRNVSRHGVLLTGLSCEVKKNEVLILSHQDRKGPFRVIWSRKHGTDPMFDAGLRALEPARSIWAIDFSGVAADECGPVERRAARRYLCSGGVSIYHPGTKHFMRGTLADLSLNGCYVEMMTPLSISDKVALVLNVKDTEIRATAEVRTSHPGMGMGLKFRDLAEKDKSNLQTLIFRLGPSGSGQTYVLKEGRSRKESGKVPDKNEAPQLECEKRRNGQRSSP
jgi:hypothetical protein